MTGRGEDSGSPAGPEGDHSKGVRLRDAASGRARASWPGVDPHSVASSPDGRTIATGDVSGAVEVRDVAAPFAAGADR